MNQVMVVGKLVLKTPNKIVVCVKDTFKNENGEYEENNIPFIIPQGIANNLGGVLPGSTIGIRGCLREASGGRVDIISDKITLLSTKQH